MGYITVEITKVPGAMKKVTLEPGATVADALRVAEIEAGAGYEIRLDNDVVTATTPVEDGSVIIVTKMVKGN